MTRQKAFSLPVQSCPICSAPGRRPKSTDRPRLALDVQCTDPACGWFYTSAATAMVLRAIAARRVQDRQRRRRLDLTP